MPDMSEEQFRQLSSEERQSVLKEMKVEQKFRRLSSGDRKGVLEVLEAVKGQQVGQVEAGVRGVAQGLTFGFADEIVAGLSAAGKKLFSDKDFKDLYTGELEVARQRDTAAESRHPATFGTAEVAGALATTAVPGGAIGKGAQLGRGLLKGIAGVGRGVATGALTAAGKSKEEFGSQEFNKEIEKAAVLSGGLQAAVNAAGPMARGLGKIVIKHGDKFAKGFAVTQAGFAKTAVAQSALKSMKKSASSKFPDLAKGLSKVGTKTSETGNQFLRILAESFEKQGGAALAATHVALLQDPAYRKFLEKGE